MKTGLLLRNIILSAILLLCGVCKAGSAGISKIVILTSSHTSQNELDALSTMTADPSRELSFVTVGDFRADSHKDADVVVYHRLDSSAFSREELNLKERILEYVREGGRLYLSMDAVRLLNDWGIESAPLSVEYQEAVDNGYGRAVGFHAYRSHPLFESLAGGAYTWKGMEDNMARTVGFSKGVLPEACGSKVIGINWAYIHYYEDRKLIWETPYGRGKILAAGAYIYYSLPNANRSTLAIFTDNVLDYLSESRMFESAPRQWNYDTRSAIPEKLPVEGLKVNVEASASPVPASPVCVRNSDRRHFWNVSGRQALLTGREKGNVEEIWIHPIMAARDLGVGVRLSNSDETVWLDTVQSEVTRCAEFTMREYRLGSGYFKEIFAASPSQPLAAVSYEWDDTEIEEVYITLASNLRLMWPYSLESTGPLLYSIADEGRTAAVCDMERELNMVSVFSKKPTSYRYGCYDFSHRDVSRFDSVPAKHKQIAFLWNFAGTEKSLTLYIAGGEEGIDKSTSLFDHGISVGQIYREASQSVEALSERCLMIKCDDAEFNEAYRSALLSTDKLFCHTPSIGKSLMAGFWSTSRGWNGGHPVSGRPGYAWYFGRDTEWTGTVMNHYGDFGKVRDILATFGRFQDPDGKIYHELTTSGSVHYDASDSTPLYLVLAGDYLRKSGDKVFISSQWDNIMKALSFCRSTDTDGDGLIENTGVGHGWQESHQLHGAHTEVYLASIWTKALEECAYMAAALGHDSIADECRAEYARCRRIVNERFWNDSIQFFNHGLMKDGSYQTQKCVLGGTPVIFGLADADKARVTALNFSSRFYSTDWGVTMVGYDSPYYATGGYNYGNVWPFHNGCAALAEYGAGLRTQGFRHAFSCLRLYKLWDYGNIAEVITGDRLDFTGICPHQQWSSSMNLEPLYKGMLGLDIDALSMSMRIEPCFPPDWNHADVAHIHIGDSRVSLGYRRDGATYSYTLGNETGGDVNISFAAVLPLASEVRWVKINGRETTFEIIREPQNVKVVLSDISLSEGVEIEVGCSGGIGVCHNLPELIEGMGNDGLKIEAEEYDEASGEYTLHLAGRPGTRYGVKILTLSKVIEVCEAALQKSEKHYSLFSVEFPDSPEPFVSKEVKLKI